MKIVKDISDLLLGEIDEMSNKNKNNYLWEYLNEEWDIIMEIGLQSKQPKQRRW